ncbi:Fc.00g048430.m01.CDS01 [Cosmosporella sp. VM-42]
MPPYGFDIVPRLPNTPSVQKAWAEMIDWLRQKPFADAPIRFHPFFAEFALGDHPILPLSGHDCVRFSSEIPAPDPDGATITKIEVIINTLGVYMREMFGNRILFWDGRKGEKGFYSCSDVQATINACRLPSKPELYRSYDEPQWSKEGHFFIGNDTSQIITVKDVPGMGKGLVARCSIPGGTRLTNEQPLLIVSMMIQNTSLDTLARLETEMKTLLSTKYLGVREEFLTLPGACPPYQLASIVRHNCFTALEGPGNHVAVYPSNSTIRWINHSCLPNAHYAWNHETKHGTVHTTRRLRPGEEITVLYTMDMPYRSDQRQERIYTQIGFKCVCEVCSLPEEQLKISDDRRTDIGNLLTHIGDQRLWPTREPSNDPQEEARRVRKDLQKCFQLTQLFAQEFLGCFGPWYHLSATFNCAEIFLSETDDTARRTGLIRRWYDMSVIYMGNDNPKTKMIKGMLDKRDSASSFFDITRNALLKRDDFGLPELPAPEFRQ